MTISSYDEIRELLYLASTYVQNGAPAVGEDVDVELHRDLSYDSCTRVIPREKDFLTLDVYGLPAKMIMKLFIDTDQGLARGSRAPRPDCIGTSAPG